MKPRDGAAMTPTQPDICATDAAGSGNLDDAYVKRVVLV